MTRASHLSEGRRWCATALTLPAVAGADTPPVRLQCLVAAGRLAIGQAAYGEAEPVVGEAVALAREHGGPVELAAVLNTQGLLARAQKRYAASAQAHAAALPLARSAGHPGEEATALLGLAYAAMFTGDAARAGALTEESLAAARTSQDRLILAQVLFFLGWGASNTGAYARAGALETEALDLFAQLGEGGEHAEALFVLGTIAIFTGDYRGAVGRCGGGGSGFRSRRGDRRRPRRAAHPDRRAVAAGAPRRLRGDAEGRAGRPRRGGLHGGARPAGAPGATGHHRRGDRRVIRDHTSTTCPSAATVTRGSARKRAASSSSASSVRSGLWWASRTRRAPARRARPTA